MGVSTERTFPYHIAGEPRSEGESLDVRDKHRGEAFARVTLAGRDAVREAVDAAVGARDAMRRLPAHRRAAALRWIADRLGERREEFARAITAEVGKPIRESRAEVDRAISTFTLSGAEALKLGGELLRLDNAPAGEDAQGFVRRLPIGACSFITPFNFPLNLAAHKVGPGIAAGCPFVLRPSRTTPVSTMLLAELLAECDLPRGAWSVVPNTTQDAEPMVSDERVRFLSFTGSDEVGWALMAKAGKKRVKLELGGDAACIVHHDADLGDAAAKIRRGAFGNAGQSCISVQRIYVHETVYADFRGRLAQAAESIVLGDPHEDATEMGPLVDADAADRIEAWVGEAKEKGATLLCGGERRGNAITPMLLEGVAKDTKLGCCEAFGPLAALTPYTDFDDALAQVNDSRYGLQAGVFTNSLDLAFRAFDAIEAGGVVINHAPTFRVDSMPYGGVKDSGIGREGPAYAIDEMTEPRLMVLVGLGGGG